MTATVSVTVQSCSHITLTVTFGDGTTYTEVTTMEDLLRDTPQEDLADAIMRVLKAYILESNITTAAALKAATQSRTFKI